MKRNYKVIFAVLFLLAAAGCPSGSGSAVPQQAVMPKITVTITNSAGQNFAISSEVATTGQQQETGLMNRTTLAPNDGMLFVFSDEQTRYFWMKNTDIPLDMIFLGADKKIVDINKNATPQSTVPFASAPARYTLEVNGGFCDKNNIKTGDSVSFEGY